MASSNKGIIVVLSVALAVALVLIGYLLGQQGTSTAVATVTAETPTPPPQPVGPAPPPRSEVRPPGPPPPGSEEAPSPPPGVEGAKEPVAEEPEKEPVDPRCAKLRDYFLNLDLATAGVESNSKDAKGEGMAALGTSLRGDSSSIDEKLRQYRKARKKLSKVRPPEGASKHYQRTVAVLDEGITLLEKVKAATASADMSAIAELPALGKRVMQLSKEVDTMGDRLQQSCAG